MKKNVFESGPKYLGALTWNHPHVRFQVSGIVCQVSHIFFLGGGDKA